jgi:acyl-phosphate glycerol 3-phosphate acyltransferase
VAIGVKGLAGETFWRDGWLEIAAGLAAFLGHCFPVYLRFRGGKGVATGAGVVAVLTPVAGVAALLSWLVVIAVWRYVSLASIVAALVLCVVQLSAYPPFSVPAQGESSEDGTTPRAMFCIAAAALAIARHRANLVRLSQGNENRLQEGAAMSQLPKVLHVLAVGLWFGMTVFFTFAVALTLFDSFEKLGQRPADHRPNWFPLAPDFAKADTEINGPKEQGTRAAGFAVGPMFTWYFLLQGVCGLVAAATSLAWTKHGRVHRWRTGLLIFALLMVLAGWPLERYVSDLRPARDAAVDAYLRADAAEVAAARSAMHEARGRFGGWHTVSLFLNFATILAVTGAMALAANFPQEKRADGMGGPTP